LGRHLRPVLLRHRPRVCHFPVIAGTHASRPGTCARYHVYQRHADYFGAGCAVPGRALLRYRRHHPYFRLYQFYGHGQVLAARRGNRTMNDLPLWVTIPGTLLLLLSGTITLIGSAGLLRFRRFYSRMHAVTLGNTMGVCCVVLTSVLVASTLAERPVL